MVSGRKRLAWGLGLGVLVLLGVGLGWWRIGSSGSRARPSRSAEGIRPAPHRDPPRPVARTEVVALRPGSSAPDTSIEEAHERLPTEATVVHCDVRGLLEDGFYEVVPPVPAHVMVRQGTLSMRVPTESGSGRLLQLLNLQGLVDWNGADCTFTVPEPVRVEGTLTDAEGVPLAGHEVRACRYGEFAVTDEDGRWEMEGMAGTTCIPMAFVEHEDGAFGKSNIVSVTLEAPGPMTDVALVLPAAEDLWAPWEQRMLADHLAQLSVQRLVEAEARLGIVESALESCDVKDEASCAVLEQWRVQEQLWVDWIAGEIGRLQDPDEQLDAFRDAWLNLY